MSQSPEPARLPSVRERAATLRASNDSPRALADSISDGIEALNPEILAFVPEPPPGRRARLRLEAAAILERWPEAAARPALFGLGVGVKDIVRVGGLPTRAGSAVPPEVLAGPEAAVVRRLREAGALIAGKTVTAEFAYFEPGATRNPRNRGHTPGGSSSGSAAAVAAGMVPLAIGTQTVGSVIRPAAFCGVAGFKPSYGRIPTDGVLPYSPSVDHVGIFAADASGLALAAAALLDDWTPLEEQTAPPTLAVPVGPYLAQATPEALAVLERQVEVLRAAGCTILERPAFADIDAITERHRWIASAEFADEHARRFAEFGALYRPRTAQLVEAGGAITSARRAAGAASRLDLRAWLHRESEEAGFDGWVCPPATGPAPEGLTSTGDPAMNLPWTHAGLPAVTLPAGIASNGLPLGLQLCARFGEDERLLAWAESLEAALETT